MAFISFSVFPFFLDGLRYVVRIEELRRQLSDAAKHRTSVSQPSVRMHIATWHRANRFAKTDRSLVAMAPAEPPYHTSQYVRGDMALGSTMEVLAFGDEQMLIRPCVDCGLYTGRYCDFCRAEDRLPNEVWATNQCTPLCSSCDNTHDCCHFCRGLQWCTPQPRQ